MANKKITKSIKKPVIKKPVVKVSKKKVVSVPKKKVVVKKKAKAVKKEKVVVVSGGFDPVHIGHVRMFNEAKAYGDRLIVVLNNDNWLRKKKGQEFMSEQERKEIIESFAAVDEVLISGHAPNSEDMSVCNELKKIKPHVFANGGDRHADNVPEVTVCQDLNCTMVYNIGQGGKVQSSSWLLKRHKEHKEKIGKKNK